MKVTIRYQFDSLTDAKSIINSIPEVVMESFTDFSIHPDAGLGWELVITLEPVEMYDIQCGEHVAPPDGKYPTDLLMSFHHD